MRDVAPARAGEHGHEVCCRHSAVRRPWVEEPLHRLVAPIIRAVPTLPTTGSWDPSVIGLTGSQGLEFGAMWGGRTP